MVALDFSRGLGLAATVLALSQAVDAAILPRQSNDALRPWVTVQADGAAKTITPTVNDGKTTSAFTGSSTLPTADANGAGSFPLCNQAAGANGVNQPFCSPKADTKVDGGKTYWSKHLLHKEKFDFQTNTNTESSNMGHQPLPLAQHNGPSPG